MDEIDLTKNEELKKALTEFEQKNQEEAVVAAPAKSDPASSKLAGWLLRHSGGMLKEETQAEYVLLAIAATFLVIAGFVFFGGRTVEDDYDPALADPSTLDVNYEN